MSDKRRKVFFKNHVLIVPTRALESQHRHFMIDIQNILPHSKKTDKIQYEKLKHTIPQLCESNKCNAFIVFHSINGTLMLTIGAYPSGPLVQFQILNICALKDLQLAGNFSKKGRMLMSFDNLFNTNIKYKLVREVLTMAFGVPQARFTDQFVDRMMSWTTEGVAENRIWMRHYEIHDNDLREIGPRLAMELISIREGMFEGTSLYQGTMISGESVIKKKMKKSEKKIEKLINELNMKEEEDDL